MMITVGEHQAPSTYNGLVAEITPYQLQQHRRDELKTGREEEENQWNEGGRREETQKVRDSGKRSKWRWWR